MLDIIKTRHSTRVFKDEMVAEDLLEKVIAAGRYAPSGCNVQNSHFVVVKNKEILNELSNLVQSEYAAMEMPEDASTSMKHSITASKEGNYVFHYNPAVLIIVANRPDNPNNIADTACAIENMMLEANALDLGSCWINQLRWLQDNDNVTGYVRKLGMADDEKVYGALALGYTKSKDGLPNRNPVDITGNKVTVIE